MDIEQAIEIIKNNFEDSRGTMIFRDEWQAVDTIEEYIKNSISKDKIKDKMKEVEFYINNVDNNEGQAIYKVLEDLLKENKWKE